MPAKRAKGGISFVVKWIWTPALKQRSAAPQSLAKNNGAFPKVHLRALLFSERGLKEKEGGVK